jgi:hypothetical protein
MERGHDPRNEDRRGASLDGVAHEGQEAVV